MCGRYALFKEIDEIDHFLGVMEKEGDYRPSYNIAPSQTLPVAYINEDGSRKRESMYWGFMGWKPKGDDKPFTMINARDDSLTKKNMWKEAFRLRRCIVPANGFFEWTGSKGNKTPHYIFPNERGLMGFAGLYSDLVPEGQSAPRSYTIITTEPNSLMEPIHDRMPAILHPSEFEEWLNPDHDDPAYLLDFLKPYPDDALAEYEVDRAVGNVRNDHPGLIQKTGLF